MKKKFFRLYSQQLTQSFILVILSMITILAQAQENSLALTRFDNAQIRESRPRIWIDNTKLGWLRQKYAGQSSEEVQKASGASIVGLSLAYVITGDKKWGRKAIEKAIGARVDTGSEYKDLDSKEGRSKTRSIQADLADRAICYDWCYALLTEKEKVTLRDLIKEDMKKRIDFKRNWRSFHNAMYASAWPVTAATIALYHDDEYANTSWEFIKQEMEDAMKTFDIVFPDGEWGEGFDYNRHSTYHAIRLLLAVKSATGYDAISGSIHMRNTGQYILYSTKQNGLALPSDDNDWPYLGDWEHVALLMLNDQFRDGYNQYFINNCPVPRFQLEPDKKYAHVLWYDASIPERKLEELPLSRIFRSKGLIMARSNWKWDVPGKRANGTWFTFHCGDYFGDHVHNDINGFSISHNGGELALDAGRYDDDWGVEVDSAMDVKQSQFFNYYRRTIAHNSVLVFDPDEKFSMGMLNDGGQKDLLRPEENKTYRNVPEDYEQGNFPSEDGIATCDWASNPGRWETGDITAYKATRNYMYVRGDGAKAYSSHKMKDFVRRIVYLQPNLFVIMDRVVSTKPEFKKTWLLHSVNEPTIDATDNSIQMLHEDGRLVSVPVWPTKHTQSKVGGPGNECLVGTTQLFYGLQSKFDPTEPHYGEIAGAWRIEQSPKVAQTEDYFFNVLMVTEKQSKLKPIVKILSEDETNITIEVKDGEKMAAIISFEKAGGYGGHIRIMKNGAEIVNEQLAESVVPEDGRF